MGMCLKRQHISVIKQGPCQNFNLKAFVYFKFKGAVAVAEFIADSPRLLRIDLRENEIKTGGLMALSLSLKISTTVTRIDLDKEPKREAVGLHFK